MCIGETNSVFKRRFGICILFFKTKVSGKISITVEDNGKGFTELESAKNGSMGLNNLKTRVAYLNGEIDFVSSPNEGTTAHIVIKI